MEITNSFNFQKTNFVHDLTHKYHRMSTGVSVHLFFAADITIYNL